MTTVLVPWRGGDPSREDAFAWVRFRYEQSHPDWRVIRCQVPIGPWCKALAVMPVVSEMLGEVLIVADADCWCEGLSEAVADVEAGAPWAIPHGGVFRLSEASTAEVLAGAEPSEEMEVCQPPYRGMEGGGFVVAHRDTMLDVPLDRRFEGWGGEDESWAVALRCLAGVPARGRRPPLWHLWHPPQERLTRRWGNTASKRLHARYIAAREDPERMRALIEEAQ